MTTTPATPTLAELVTANPAVARVLDRVGLDYCCHGDRALDVACVDAGIDVDEVRAAVEALPVDADTAWAELDIAELADHIERTHHAYLHDELGALASLAAKVRDVHGGRHPELGEVAELVDAIRADLEPHLAKEERVLFPAIRAIVGGRRSFPFGPIANPIAVMTVEHDRAGELLADLRLTANDFVVPADGCASYRSLYERLEALELDTHLHVLKENHVLFPQAIARAGEP